MGCTTDGVAVLGMSVSDDSSGASAPTMESSSAGTGSSTTGVGVLGMNVPDNSKD